MSSTRTPTRDGGTARPARPAPGAGRNRPAGSGGRRTATPARRGRSRRAPRARWSRPAGWRRALALWGALVGALTGALVVLFFLTGAFTVEEVTVTGVEPEMAQVVLEDAAIPEGRPMARVFPARISDRVLQDLRVSSVTVSRDWPSTVTLAVELRRPALALTHSGSTWLADAQGTVYEQVESAARRLPSVRVSDPPEALAPETVTGLVELWRTRPDPAVLQGDLETPRLGADGAVTLTIGQATVLWGPPTETALKWQVVAALVGQDSIDPDGVEPVTIDVRAPRTPVVSGIPAAAP